jgi:ribosomal 50S subunit-recycling heat shock protein
MKVRMIEDYQGVQTGDKPVKAGAVIEMDDPLAVSLINTGKAVEVVEPEKKTGKGE